MDGKEVKLKTYEPFHGEGSIADIPIRHYEHAVETVGEEVALH
ncbi:hypothetical protein [Thermanaeromonas sp. C210]|nr:hypothetical protein [Thermanaeromonas sp. C210]GFN23802.1 hypothetical protein TAMC210_21190 [Thermanaeromonas sp. C210]